jgi:hypothetical protein
MLPLPVQFLIAMVAHATNAHMARRGDYLLEQVRVLREIYAQTTGRKRIAGTDDHWRFPRQNSEPSSLGVSSERKRACAASLERLCDDRELGGIPW